MRSADTLRSIAGALWSFWQKGSSVERTGYRVGALLVLSGLVHLSILTVSGGSWEGPLSLRKAGTFGLSFGLTLLTVVWVTSWVRIQARARGRLLVVFAIACTIETALVTLQAWRGVPSHFNIETPFDSLVARTLAAGGLTLIAVILTFLVAAFRDNPGVPPSLMIAIRSGFLTLSVSLMVGALMIARGMRLVLAGDASRAYATGGTFKPTHAVTMHAILVLPVLAWLISFANWTETRRTRVVTLGTASYLVVAAVVSIQNTLGRDPWDGMLPVALLIIGLAGLVMAGGLALDGVTRTFTSGGIRRD
jgi:hypothetical protein